MLIPTIAARPSHQPCPAVPISLHPQQQYLLFCFVLMVVILVGVASHFVPPGPSRRASSVPSTGLSVSHPWHDLILTVALSAYMEEDTEVGRDKSLT